MKAEIKRFCIWDNRSQQFYPENPDYFFAIVDMDIGLEGSEGGDLFNLKVCTPRWFEDHEMTIRPNDPTHEAVRKNMFGRHYLFVSSFDEAKIEEEVQRLVHRVEGKDWNELALRLSQFFAWEYENFNEDVGLQPSF